MARIASHRSLQNIFDRMRDMRYKKAEMVKIHLQPIEYIHNHLPRKLKSPTQVSDRNQLIVTQAGNQFRDAETNDTPVDVDREETNAHCVN